MVTLREDGSCEFRIYLPHARDVRVVGDFTGWREHALAMGPAADGWWTLRARLPAGDHLFNYLVDGDAWLPDYAAHGIQPNAWGGWVSMLAAPEADEPGLSTPRPGHPRSRRPGAARVRPRPRSPVPT